MWLVGMPLATHSLPKAISSSWISCPGLVNIKRWEYVQKREGSPIAILPLCVEFMFDHMGFRQPNLALSVFIL